MLLDLHLALAPRLTVIDAIVAMQGKGPGSGTPRAMGSLFAATDAQRARRGARRPHGPRAPPHLHAGRRRAPRPDRPRRPLPPRGRPHRARPRLRALAARRPGPAAAGAAPPRCAARSPRGRAWSNPAVCTRCGDCAQICGASAITLAPRRSTTTTSACAATPAPRSARRPPSRTCGRSRCACWEPGARRSARRAPRGVYRPRVRALLVPSGNQLLERARTGTGLEDDHPRGRRPLSRRSAQRRSTQRRPSTIAATHRGPRRVSGSDRHGVVRAAHVGDHDSPPGAGRAPGAGERVA